MNQIKLSYGSEQFTFTWNDSHKVNILKPSEMPSLKDPEASIKLALENTIDSQSLSQISNGKKRIAISVPDKTRKTKLDLILPIILEKLNDNGIDSKNVTIILARGTHPPHSEDEKKKLLGQLVYENCNIIDHDCFDDENCIEIGKTKAGTTVSINRHFIEADLKIIVGAVIPHYIAGYGGGRKLVVPGISAHKTIMSAHGQTINAYQNGLPLEKLLMNTENNPMHDDILEACHLVNPNFCVNVVLNSKGDINEIICGHWKTSHQKACDHVYNHMTAECSHADMVLASAGGFPKDINLIQSHKTLHNSSFAAKPNGKIFMLAECAQGIGSNEAKSWLKIKNDKEIFNKLKNKFSIGGHTVWSFISKCKNFDVNLLTTLENDYLNSICTTNSDFESIRRSITELLDKGYELNIIPEGSITIPRI